MSIVTYNDTVDEQGLVQDLRFLSGQDNLSLNDATRILNYALDDYWHLALVSAGLNKPDGRNYTNLPDATTPVAIGTNKVTKEREHFVLDELQMTYNSKDYVLERKSATRDTDGTPFSRTYKTNSRPKYYDEVGDIIFLYPAPDKTITLHQWYTRPYKHFSPSDITVDIGIPYTHAGYLSLKGAKRLGFRTADTASASMEQELRKKENEIKEYFGLRDNNAEHRLLVEINVPN